MRLVLGPPPPDPGFRPEEGGWHRLREPRAPLLTVLAALPLGALSAMAYLTAAAALAPGRRVEAQVTPAVLALLAALVPVHELLHAACFPAPLRSPRVALGLWPRAMVCYAYFAGELSRGRMVAVCLCPWATVGALTLLAAAVDAARAAAWLGLGALHAVTCCVDLLAVLLVGLLPRGARLRNHGWHTYWRPPGGAPAPGSP